VDIRVARSETALWVDVSDEGGARPIPEPATPDIEAKLAGRERARGWGLFLMQRLSDGVSVTSDGVRHTVRLTFRLAEEPDPLGEPGGPSAPAAGAGGDPTDRKEEP